MAFQPVPYSLNAQLRFTDVSTGKFLGVNSLNFSMRSPTAPDAADCALLYDQIVTWFTTYLDGVMSSDCQLQRLTIRALDAAEAPYFDGTPNLAGTQTGERLGSKTTVAVAFKTGLTGRSTRGRAFMCGLVETQVLEEALTNAYAEALIDAWEGLKTTLDAEEVFDHVVLSRFGGGVKRAEGLTTKVTSYILTDLVLDTRRKRIGI